MAGVLSLYLGVTGSQASINNRGGVLRVKDCTLSYEFLIFLIRERDPSIEALIFHARISTCGYSCSKWGLPLLTINLHWEGCAHILHQRPRGGVEVSRERR